MTRLGVNSKICEVSNDRLKAATLQVLAGTQIGEVARVLSCVKDIKINGGEEHRLSLWITEEFLILANITNFADLIHYNIYNVEKDRKGAGLR